MGCHDYVIVGTGSVGCVLANRLSAQAGKRVLLLEIGAPDWNRRLNWNYRTEVEPALNQRRL